MMIYVGIIYFKNYSMQITVFESQGRVANVSLEGDVC